MLFLPKFVHFWQFNDQVFSNNWTVHIKWLPKLFRKLFLRKRVGYQPSATSCLEYIKKYWSKMKSFPWFLHSWPIIEQLLLANWAECVDWMLKWSRKVLQSRTLHDSPFTRYQGILIKECCFCPNLSLFGLLWTKYFLLTELRVSISF